LAVQTDTTDTVGGTPFALTVTAVDAAGNPISNFSGTIQFSSTDPDAVLPDTSTVDRVTETFIVSLASPGTQTITVSTVEHSLTGSSDPIYVAARPALVITTVALPEGSVGIPYGPSTLVYQRCVWSPVFGWHYSCVPTTLADCETLPRCGIYQNNLKPCCRAETGHIGAPLSASGAITGINWTVAGAPNSSVPPGLRIDGDGLVGTPAPGSAGNYEVVLTATDDGLPSAETSVTLSLIIQK
jgi:hypothetical protein